MTEETPDHPEDFPADEKGSAKKAARKRPVARKSPAEPENSETDPAGNADVPPDDPAAKRQQPTPKPPEDSPREVGEPKVTVDERRGIETREIASENARRVSSKRVRPAPGEADDAKRERPAPGETDGNGASRSDAPEAPAAERGGEKAGDEVTIPVITEPPGGDDGPGGGKRRRRRKRKGGDEGEPGEPAPEKRPSIDPDAVVAKAWKIFKAEIGEEGLALINDNDAREISRRSFRLAEIFLEEAARRG